MGKQWKQWQTFILGGSKITVDGDCNHEIKRCLLLGRKAMTNLDSIFKIRDITLPTKVHLVKAMVFPVVMYGCESWTIKKAERRNPSQASHKQPDGQACPSSLISTWTMTGSSRLYYTISQDIFMEVGLSHQPKNFQRGGSIKPGIH